MPHNHQTSPDTKHRDTLTAIAPIPRDASLVDAPPDGELPGSRRSDPDDVTLGGIPTAEARRARRLSWHGDDRPTQPHLHAPGEMPAGATAPDAPAPNRQRALDLARSFLLGPDAQRVVGRDGCEEMARWIIAQPDDVLTLDDPAPATITDLEILDLARSCRDGTATDALARQTCIIALGIGGPVSQARALVRGATRDEIVAQARAWCVAKINERAQAARIGAARIWTPRDDGSCAVCGQPLAQHQTDVDDGCPVAGARGCGAVAP